MTEVQAGLLMTAAACAGMAFFMHGKGALSRAGLIAVLAVDGTIAGFLYWAQ